MDLTSLQAHMENFYLCSHLPIRAYDQEGNELLSTGFSSHFLDLTTKLPTWLHQAQTLLQLQNTLTFTPITHVHFTLCPINPHFLEKGLYMIGPYTTSTALKEDFLLKPGHCIPHLITLLYNLDTGMPSLEEKTVTIDSLSYNDYSYHISKAQNYIHSHYNEPITLDSLAQYLGLNKSYLCTIFKKVTKDSFCNYTNKVRIEESKKLLANTNDSMLDIALAVGFNSASYFNTIFKKLEGTTPLEYKKWHKNREIHFN